jgi:hypothetical protein
MSASKRLELSTFERLLEVHGGSVEGWPEDLRRPAQELLESSEAARAAWSQARRLDALLGGLPDVAPSAQLIARIASLPLRHPHSGKSWWPFGHAFAPLLAWGAAAALGLIVGSVAAPELPAFQVEPTAELGQNDDWSELSELALGADFALEDEP